MDKINLLGESEIFLNVMAEAGKIAASSARVLIGGETGTGKEEMAKYLHANSARRGKPFVVINCSALPAALMESELFGHVTGAFTTAHHNHDGLISTANGGTLFLDEIAEMDFALQAKLLRFLETGEYRKVGSAQNEYADVRVFAATHQNLKNLAAQNLFRQDLYYRLAVIALEMPALRQRKADILLLADYFLKKLSAQEGKNPPAWEPEAVQLLKGHYWLGNIRELQNLVHKTVVLGDAAAVSAAAVSAVLEPCRTAAADNIVDISQSSPRAPRPLWQVEQEAIEAAVNYCKGNVLQAAALLKINPSTIYRKMGNKKPN